jgi:hypothetical protein
MSNVVELADRRNASLQISRKPVAIIAAARVESWLVMASVVARVAVGIIGPFALAFTFIHVFANRVMRKKVRKLGKVTVVPPTWVDTLVPRITLLASIASVARPPEALVANARLLIADGDTRSPRIAVATGSHFKTLGRDIINSNQFAEVQPLFASALPHPNACKPGTSRAWRMVLSSPHDIIRRNMDRHNRTTRLGSTNRGTVRPRSNCIVPLALHAGQLEGPNNLVARVTSKGTSLVHFVRVVR